MDQGNEELKETSNLIQRSRKKEDFRKIKLKLALKASFTRFIIYVIKNLMNSLGAQHFFLLFFFVFLPLYILYQKEGNAKREMLHLLLV